MKIIDMHCDTIYEIWARGKRGEQIQLEENQLMVDLKRLQAGGYYVQNFALFVEQEEKVSSFEKVKQLLCLFQEEMRRQKDWISQVTTTYEILENERSGRLSALLTVEGGEACEGSLEKLQYLYEQGVRMLTLTWNFSNEIGFPNVHSEELKDWTSQNDRNVEYPYPANTNEGLTEKGICYVQEMERLGMIIDVSHLSDKGFYDVLQYTKRPFVASHSNARAICPWIRNLTDDMIRRLSERGGVIGLNFCGDFLRLPEERKKESFVHGDRAFLRTQADSQATLEDIVKHAKHIVQTGGIDCIGFGGDLDGIPEYSGRPRINHMEELIHAFEKAGFHESEIDKICYGNVFRLYRDILG